MKKIEGFTQQEAKKRFFDLIKKCGLSPLGIETLLGYKSEGKYVSAIRSGSKLTTNSLIIRLLEKFEFTVEDFKNLDSKSSELKIAQTLSDFNKEHYGTDISKFYETENQTTSTVKLLIQEGYFSTKRTSPEILTKFKELGLNYTSNDLSRDLSNLVSQKILRARKITKINKDGSMGKKMVNEYWVE
jgi:hypothetical protein